uniref:E3 ubiquitin-protein ligase TRAIP isoform X2 n=1 Tax=Myxine glutinosa TaxID=7769 RepID=UPI00358DE750
MPLRARCTICSDLFDNSQSTSAILCGHVFHEGCLDRWLKSARTCPQCREKVTAKNVISKLYFDVIDNDSSQIDPETLKDDVDKLAARLHVSDRELLEQRQTSEDLSKLLQRSQTSLCAAQKSMEESEQLCATLRKQNHFLENQAQDAKKAQEETWRLNQKLKNLQKLDELLRSKDADVEEMVRDMGSGHNALERLSMYCISLKREYEQLKDAHQTALEENRRTQRRLHTCSSKLQQAEQWMGAFKKQQKESEEDMEESIRQTKSLKQKLELLKQALPKLPHTNELSRAMLESPAPLQLQPRMCPTQDENTDGENWVDDFSLNVNLNPSTPEMYAVPSRHRSGLYSPRQNESIKDTNSTCANKEDRPIACVMKSHEKESEQKDNRDLPEILRKAMPRPYGSLLAANSKYSQVRIGFDGLGGRTKFIQPVSSAYANKRFYHDGPNPRASLEPDLIFTLF